MFGQPEFAGMNTQVNEILAAEKVLIVAHRGSAGGSVAANTTLAIKAALLQGARMMELDVTASSDGEFYCFHDGLESELLGISPNLQTLSAAEIDQASYVWVDRPGRTARVERLLPMLGSLADTGALFNIDRSWWRWPSLLQALEVLRVPGQMVMKCPAWEGAALDRLREFSVKYPFVPICATPDDVRRVTNDPALNTVGVELITNTREHPWFDPEVIAHCHANRVFVLVSAITLPTGIPLFGGLDDELAITEGPERAFGPLLDLGVDAIQTDWPAILRGYRDQWLARAAG